MKARTGNFVSNIDEFDNKFFKISPREAKSMDPQQRLLLHASYQALEDAGYVANSTPSFRQETFGVYVGAATHDYLENLRNEIDVFYSTGKLSLFFACIRTVLSDVPCFFLHAGTLGAFLSGRISYAMQFGGPSVVIDTACSSSVVAVYQGCRALMNRDCNSALVGGVNIISSPDVGLSHTRISIHSYVINRCTWALIEVTSSARPANASPLTPRLMDILEVKARPCLF